MKKRVYKGRVMSMLGAAAVASTLTLAGAPALAVMDNSAVQLPSIASDRVAMSLLQDIVRVGDRLVVVGERGHIAYSDDNGKTWQQASVPTRQMLNAVYFTDAQHGWAVGYDGLVLNTEDGGATWAIQLDGIKFTRKRMADRIPVLEGQIKQLEQQKVLADAELTKAQDNGAEDTSAQEDAIAALEDKVSNLEGDLDDAKKAAGAETVANPLMDVWFRDSRTGFAVGAFGDFIKTEDGGVTWVSVSDRLENPEHNHLNAITGSGDLMYIAGEAGHLYRSTDGGAHWVTLASPDPENGSFFAVNILSDNEVMISGLRGSLYRSSDRGNNWKSISEDLHKNMNALYFAGKDTVVAVGNDGALMRSRDNGRTFKSHVQGDRLTIAGVVQAADGRYVLVGAGGVKLVEPDSL